MSGAIPPRPHMPLWRAQTRLYLLHKLIQSRKTARYETYVDNIHYSYITSVKVDKHI